MRKYFIIYLSNEGRDNRVILVDSLDGGRLVDYVLGRPSTYKILKIKRVI